jgi:hypothetical protein
MGRLRHARHVQHPRNAGWPNGREPQGHGVSVVVGGGESPPQGEGRQVGRHFKGEGSEMDDYLIRVDVAPLESCLTSKESRAVRRGAVGKVPAQVTRRPPTLLHGLRKIEQAVLKRRCIAGSEPAAGADAAATTAVIIEPAESPTLPADPAGAVVLDYCAAVRGILNDDQGGPLQPPGLRMAQARDEVRESIQHNLDEKTGGSRSSNSVAWPVASTVASTK